MFFTTLRIVIIVANLSMLLIVVVWIWLDSVHSVCWNGFVVWWSSEQVNHIYTIIMYRISYFVARSHWHRVILVILWHDLPWGATRHCSISLSLSPVLNCATWKGVPQEIRQLYLQVCNNDYIYIYVYEYNCHLRSGRNISSCRLEPGDSNLEMKWEGFWLKQITAAVSQAKVARRPWIGRSLSLSEWLRQMQTGTLGQRTMGDDGTQGEKQVSWTCRIDKLWEDLCHRPFYTHTLGFKPSIHSILAPTLDGQRTAFGCGKQFDVIHFKSKFFFANQFSDNFWYLLHLGLTFVSHTQNRMVEETRPQAEMLGGEAGSTKSVE